MSFPTPYPNENKYMTGSKKPVATTIHTEDRKAKYARSMIARDLPE